MRLTLGASGAVLACLVPCALGLAQASGASIGPPHAGWLDGGTRLEDVPGVLRFASAHGHPEARFGTPTLVAALERAARSVAAAHPGSEAVFSDLSREHGGPMRFHGSHTSGRDADVLYFAVDDAGSPLPARYVAFDAAGHAADGGPERIDGPRTWAMIAALLEDDAAHVAHVFVAPHVETLLLAAGRTAHAPASLLGRARRMLQPPGTSGASPHDEHFHVRIACPASDHACVDHARDVPGLAALPAGWGAVLVAAEDHHEAYADGARIGSGVWYHETSVYARPGGAPSFVAVRVEATRGVPASLACEVHLGGGRVVTADASWRVLAAASAPEGWERPELDDSRWAHASVVGTARAEPWFAVPYLADATPRVAASSSDARVLYFRSPLLQ